MPVPRPMEDKMPRPTHQATYFTKSCVACESVLRARLRQQSKNVLGRGKSPPGHQATYFTKSCVACESEAAEQKRIKT
jgi:hypothetical protein